MPTEPGPVVETACCDGVAPEAAVDSFTTGEEVEGAINVPRRWLTEAEAKEGEKRRRLTPVVAAPGAEMVTTCQPVLGCRQFRSRDLNDDAL